MNPRATPVAFLVALVIPLAGFAPFAALAPSARAATLEDTGVKIYASLTDDQKKKATLPFDSPERTREVFTGGERAGIHIKDLNADQQKLAEELLGAFTSDAGKKKSIEIADQPSNTNDPTTGFARYYLCFFGEPGAGKTYAWRIAEHHLTLVHVEVEKGQPVRFGPILLGANPPTLFDAEEDLMLALHAAMTPAERERAQQPGKGISTEAWTGDGGIRVGELNESARKAAAAVLENRLSFFAEPIRARVMQILDSRGGLEAMRIGFYGRVDKKCRDGGRWDFKLAAPRGGFLCDYEGSRAHIHLSMKGQLAEPK